MGIVIDGSNSAGTINLGTNGTVTNLAVGGIPDGTVDTDALATNAVTNVKVADDAIGVAELSTTGTAGSGNFLRGDNSWQEAGGGQILKTWSTWSSGKKTTTSSSYVDMAEKATITIQKTGTKMLVMVSCTFGVEGQHNGTNDGNALFRVVRTVSGSDTDVWSTLCKATYLHPWETNGYGPGAYAADMGQITFLDTHGVSAGSTLTYALQAQNKDGPTPTCGGRDDDGSYSNGVSFVLMEVDV